MSASILRELVASIFKIKATSVILSGVISPYYIQSENNSSGGMWSENSSNILWGFNSQKGFICLSEYSKKFFNDGHDGPLHSEGGIKLIDIPEVDSYIFFVEVKEEGYSCPSNNEDRFGVSYTLFKSANFADYRDKINNQDIVRWEQWINAEEK